MKWAHWVILLEAAAFWPVWEWLWHRLSWSAESVGFVLLSLAAVFLIRQQPPSNGKPSLTVPMLLLLVYGAGFHHLPPLARGGLAWVTLGVSLSLLHGGRLPSLPVWGLLLLSLPVLPSLQFFLGYPARVAAAALTVPLLTMTGLHVQWQGTALLWEGEMIQFDAPCSGIRMLWSGLLVTLVMAGALRLSWGRALIALSVTPFLVLAANALRGAALFPLEAGLIPGPSWWHEGIGVVVFAFLAFALVAMTRALR